MPLSIPVPNWLTRTGARARAPALRRTKSCRSRPSDHGSTRLCFTSEFDLSPATSGARACSSLTRHRCGARVGILRLLCMPHDLHVSGTRALLIAAAACCPRDPASSSRSMRAAALNRDDRAAALVQRWGYPRANPAAARSQPVSWQPLRLSGATASSKLHRHSACDMQ